MIGGQSISLPDLYPTRVYFFVPAEVLSTTAFPTEHGDHSASHALAIPLTGCELRAIPEDGNYLTIP